MSLPVSKHLSLWDMQLVGPIRQLCAVCHHYGILQFFLRKRSLFSVFSLACLRIVWYNSHMPRRARVTMLDVPHHVCQYGLEGRAIFTTDKDRKAYLEQLKEEADYYKLDIIAYCLMKDRVQLVVIPRKRGALGRAIGRTHFWYAQYHNRKRKRDGKLWHDRFHSCIVDEKFLLQAVQYVECQPVFGKVVKKAEKYAWSSAPAHATGKDELGILSRSVPTIQKSRKRWAQILAKKLDAKVRETIAANTRTGRPFGSDAFITKLEKKFRRRLRALPTGRPKKDA